MEPKRHCRVSEGANRRWLRLRVSGSLRPIADTGIGCDCALMGTNQKFKCCYCDKEIEPSDRAALRITVTGLWSSAHEAAQNLFAHSKCAADKFAGNFSQWVPFDVRTFEPE